MCDSPARKVSRACDESLIAPTEEALEGQEIIIQDENDIEPVKVMHDPGQPTQVQVEQHRVAHVPYRSWCRWCVLGRGRGLPHKRSAGSAIPIVAFDYFYMTKTDGHEEA